jgi:DNA-binding NtrC family response regulator
MTRVAVIEDDLPTSNQLAAGSAPPARHRDRPVVHRDDAEAALAREAYDVVLLDIELGRERHAGVALINAINKRRAGVPVLVVSAMPAAIYRSIMKALDAWDYLQKTDLRGGRLHRDLPRDPAGGARAQAQQEAPQPRRRRTRARPAVAAHAHLARRAHQPAADGAAHPGHAVPAARRSGSYEDLFDVVKSGRNRDNVRKHVSTIRDAFREVDPQF